MKKSKIKTYIPLNHDTQKILTGVLAGSLFGLGLGILIAPKKSMGLKGELYNAYLDLSNRTGEIKENLIDQGSDIYSKFQEWIPETVEFTNHPLLVGGILGGLLGAASAYAIHRRNGSGASQKFNGSFSKGANWVKCAMQVVDRISDSLEEKKTKKSNSDHFNNLFQLADIGFRAYQSYKQRR